ncbi:hypothetical protein ABIE89_000423 [Bradyrhizobium niftali]
MPIDIYVRSQWAGERVLVSIERFLEKRLKLTVNKAKSAVAKPSVRKFLAFSFSIEPRRPYCAAGARPHQGESSGADAAHAWPEPCADCQGVVRLSIGWRGYLAYAKPHRIARPRSMARAAVASILRKQWKRGSTFSYAQLRRRGVGRHRATRTAGGPHGLWRLANSPAFTIAMPSCLSPHSACPPSWHIDVHNPPNRRIRTRMSGSVGASRDTALSQLAVSRIAENRDQVRTKTALSCAKVVRNAVCAGSHSFQVKDTRRRWARSQMVVPRY